MPEPTLFDLFQSPNFWFGTVIVGIIVGVIGNFLSGWIQKVYARYSERQRKKNQEKERRFQKDLQRLFDVPSEVLELRIKILYDLLKDVLFLFLVIIIQDFFSSVSIFTRIINPIMILFAITIINSGIMKSAYSQQLLRAYDRQKTKERES